MYVFKSLVVLRLDMACARVRLVFYLIGVSVSL